MHIQKPLSAHRFSWHGISCGQAIVLLISLLFMGLASMIATPAYAASTSTIPKSTYINKTLGFSLQLPTGWVATPHTSIHNTGNADVIFTNTALPGTHLEINVERSSAAPANFARQGKAKLAIGGYPAFQMDTHGGKNVAFPCLVRVLLAHNDIVTASWCAKDASAHVAQFESMLATYHDHAITSANSKAMPQTQTPVNSVQSCGQIMQNPGPEMWGNFPTGDATFGGQMVSPNDPNWTNSFGEGVAVCNDYYSGGGYMWESSYLFQCTELANRFINEEWNLPEIGVDAFAYYDSYQNGVEVPGAARGAGYGATLVDDASQGNNSAPPVPGDLLVFQDVTDGVHWTSGQIAGDPGHIVVVTGVTSNTVNVVQQNWHNGETHSFALEHLSNGYHIVDNSGWTGRITRGWIHFSANGGSGTPPPPTPSKANASPTLITYADGSKDLIAVGSDGRMWHNWTSSSNKWIGWNWWSNSTPFANATPTLIKYANGSMDLIAVGSDGRMWHNWTSGSENSWIGWNWWSTNTPFAAAAPTLITYADGSKDLIAVGTDGRMWHNWTSSSNSWIGWNWWSTNTPFAAAAPTLVTYADGSKDLIAVGTDGRMWHNWTSSSNSWIGWNWWSTNTPFAAASPTLITYTDGSKDLIAVGTDGRIWHNWTSSSNSWIGWNWWSTNTVYATAPTTLITYTDGSKDLIAVGKDGRMWHNWTSGSESSWIGWNWWSTNTPFAAAAPTLITYTDGSKDLIAVGSDGRMWHNWTSSSNSWIGWNWWSNNTPFV
ncbi:hypothetical protein [Dictyobacter arantiisoli]|uniref:Peptidase C51 domain-containing protein n=1 Tax=Dictyobacter arantiisoli TaxID=2014874 RepID=A0A5A5TBW4_9CHLR|nr:hypothetical protein [Dictyobacter arantiisoli]GCF08499.1 hypothetical protein KDI_20630 [Dictyobacter arantiisoli]